MNDHVFLFYNPRQRIGLFQLTKGFARSRRFEDKITENFGISIMFSPNQLTQVSMKLLVK